MQLFFRKIDSSHPLEAHLLAARSLPMKGVSGRDRAVAHSLAMDHRVSKEREDEFMLHCQNYLARNKGDSLFKALEDYQKNECSLTSIPAFERPSNQNNFVPGAELRLTEPLLAVLVSVNHFKTALSDILQSDGAMTAATLGPRRGGLADYSHVFHENDELDGTEKAEWSETRRKLASDCTKRMAELRESGEVARHNPIWAASGQRMKMHQDLSPSCWYGLVGKTPGRNGLVFQVVYPSDRYPQVYRPTQLDSGNFALHCPSPPDREPKRGGLTVCHGPVCNREPVAEYIHREAGFEPEDFHCWKEYRSSDEASLGDWEQRIAWVRRKHCRKMLASASTKVQRSAIWKWWRSWQKEYAAAGNTKQDETSFANPEPMGHSSTQMRTT